ncbi:MAG: metal-dependent transcriptional regulator [Planctomycetes bacterium]|nr:metal-dependent transcriptional regulator [Planctomycetota bacterium]
MHETLKVTAVLEDYLEAIYHLSTSENGARSRDIAESLNVHKSTVTSALRALREMRLIHYSPYEAVTLTDEGKKVARDVVRRHDTLKGFFTEVLGVDAAMAEKAACGMEHSMPREIVDKLALFARGIRKTQAEADSEEIGDGGDEHA